MENDSLIKNTTNLYSGLGWKSVFAKIRLWDAPYKHAETVVPRKGLIVELGCGEGLFSNYLALSSDKRKIIGVELDENRVKIANRGLPNAKFIHADANKAKFHNADAIVMMHLLHHLNSFEEQEKLIRSCLPRIKKSGKLVIIEVEPKFSLKYLISWLTDHFLVAWLFERKIYSSIYFRKKSEWIKMLSGMGFKVDSYSAEKGMPFSHIIFDCVKK